MKKISLALLKYLSKKFQDRIIKIENANLQLADPNISIHSFNSLSPVGNADPEGEYAKALRWALKNRKEADIKNIALTGPYGSGKSSILKTFQAHNTDPDLSFLNISLATFKEETENENSPKGANLLRLIELSILQQIFYHEEDHKIPDSRFKKIKSFKKKHLWFLSIGLFLLAIATIHLFNKTLIEEMLGFKASALVKLIANLLSVAVVIAGYFYIIFKSIRTISSITINKLNIKDAEIAISDSISKSILNNHIDEILYFFEVTKYTVVVIEDLDRFEQTEIFTKLRELNLLINYSDKIKREIVFIYAVRDDMFKDKDRTKFFDFIIPVIPVINSSNSNEKLMEIVKANLYNIKPELIENISLFIDDMRLLYNVTNEYYIYHKKLGKLNQDKLMSMIVYKNIYPNDFVDLSNGEGKLYTVFTKKEAFVKERTDVLDTQILNAKSEIKKLEAMLLTDIHELRKIYVYKYIEQLPKISGFQMNGNDHSFSEVITDEIFQFFVDNKARYNCFALNYSNSGYHTPTTKNIDLKFAKVEAEVDADHTYQERLELVQDWNNGKIEDLKTKISELENEKNKLRHLKVKDIIAMGGCKMELENKKQLQLVNILLRNGYIGEDYLDYISIFYEGSITKEDREFLLNVKAQIASEHNYQLNKIDKLIPKIDAVDFTQSYVLNYNLLDYLLSKIAHKTQKAALLNVLRDESKNSVTFINGFIDNSKQLGIFIKEMSKVWPNIWHYLSHQSDFPKERIQLYFKLILQHADITDITLIAEKSNLKAEITDQTDFLSIDINPEKLKQIIKTLDIKFVRENLAEAPKDLALYVYNNNHYALNEGMVKTVINVYGNFVEEDFNTRNFYAVSRSGSIDLISYVDLQINSYVSGLYFSLVNNSQENEGALIDLLNHEKLSLDYKKIIIDKVETKVIDIENIEQIDVKQYLLETSSLVPKWNNLIYYYHELEDEFDEYLISFINVQVNAKLLSSTLIDIKKPVPDIETVKKFILTLIKANEISNTCYKLVLNSVPYAYNTLTFKELSRDKVQMLIQNQKLNATVVNYDLLRSDFNGLHIMLAEQKHALFVQNILDYVVEEPEVFGLLSSNLLTIPEKNKIIAHVGDEIIVTSARVSGLVGALSISSDQLVVSKEVILHVLLNRLTAAQRIHLLVKKFDLLTKDEIFNVLSALPEPYSEIAVMGKRPTLEGHQLNWDLAGKLVRKGYIKRATEEKGKIRISTFRQ